MDTENTKKPKRLKKVLITLLCFLVLVVVAWTAFSLIGRVRADSLIPDSAILRLSISNPMRLLEGVMSHESLQEIADIPSLAPAVSTIKSLEDGPLLKNRLVRMAARGNIELALLPASSGNAGKSASGTLIAVWDMGMFSPLLRIFPTLAGFVTVPNLYYVSAGKNSRFEFRLEDKTFFIGPYRNLLFISDSSSVFESRANLLNDSGEKAFNVIKPSAYDAVLQLSPVFIGEILAEQDASIAAILDNIEFDSAVEAGISVFQKKLEFRLAAPLSSRNSALKRLLEQRSNAPEFTERLPSASQYATILSAGTLEELYSAAQVFSGPALEETINRADSSARTILGLTLNDLLFSWSGKEFAAVGIEGRPNQVYLIQVNDERKRQEVFDKAFSSIVLNENLRLNLDGVRIPRIEVPEFLQSLLRRWNLFLPSPYYTVYKDCLLISESADALLSVLRSMQRNESLIKTAAWREIAGGKTASSSFSLYYSLDRSLPFFLRKNTALSGFLGIYRQGLVRMSFDKGVVEISLSMVPGSGNGVTLVNTLAIDSRGRLSNRIYGTGRAGDSRVFLSAGDKVLSIDLADNSVKEFSGQGQLWILPAGKTGDKDAVKAWVVSERGRVLLVDSEMETAQGFPVLTGLRLSSPPQAHEGRLYLCDEDGKVHSIDANGNQSDWETEFPNALRSPPFFLTLASRNNSRSYAAVYPKSFFGEIWLLDADGKTLPNWPISISSETSSGIGFGSPLLFAHNNSVHLAFVSQDGELSIFDENADAFQRFPIALDGVFYQQPVFDGEYLWLVSEDGTFFRVSLAGEILSQNIPGFSVKEEGFITTFDCNGDKIPEVFITGEGNDLHAYTRNFRSLEGFPLPVWGKPLFVEAGGKEKAEIIGMGMDRRLYRWQFR
jgi:hypothetical protein